MSIPAPQTRLVDALSGEIASPILGILATADHITDGLADAEQLREENAELHTRVQELESENVDLRDRVRAESATRDGLTHDAVRAATRQQRLLEESGELLTALAAERDELAEKLRVGDEAHQITLDRLAKANAQLKRMAATR